MECIHRVLGAVHWEVPGWGSVCLKACWALPLPLMPKQACLHGSGVSRDSALMGHLPWNFAAIMPGSARNSSILFLFYSIRWEVKAHELKTRAEVQLIPLH